MVVCAARVKCTRVTDPPFTLIISVIAGDTERVSQVFPTRRKLDIGRDTLGVIIARLEIVAVTPSRVTLCYREERRIDVYSLR